MEVSPNALRKDTVDTLRDVNDLLARTHDSNLIQSNLLLARATCLNTLTQLREQGTQSKRRPLPT